VVFLAENDNARWTAQKIAEATQVPPGYLAKVMQNLARAEVVDSQRGVHGGFSLRKAPHQVTVLTVIEAVDPIQRIRACPLGLEAHRHQLCPLHSRLDAAIALMEDGFRRSSIAELVGKGTFEAPRSGPDAD
jgi:Rrf2 family protein